MNTTAFKLLGVAAALFAATAHAEELNVISFGGANGKAQVKAYYEPYTKATGTKIVPVDYNGEMAKVKAMVDGKNITWDVVEVETPELLRGCEEGLFEKIDIKQVGTPADFVKGSVSECGVGIFVWSTVIAYNADKIKGEPKSWADFWDVKKFPGKRGLRKGAKYTRSRLPVTLVFSESCESKSAALKRERELKSWSRAEKEALITARPPASGTPRSSPRAGPRSTRAASRRTRASSCSGSTSACRRSRAVLARPARAARRGPR